MLKQAMQVPDWAKSSIYQINPRTFSSEGTINAITGCLNELASLGFGVMYLCPVFKEDEANDGWSPRQIKSGTMNPKNPYRIADYFAIDPEYGDMDDLKLFVDTAHQFGMKVILDLVYLHAGPNAAILKARPDFAKQDSFGNWLLNKWNFTILDYANPGIREYLWCNMVYFISVIDVDGFRCDVGDRIPEDFWVEGRRRIRSIKKDAVLINEGSNFDWMRNAFDVTYGFAWHVALYKVYVEAMPARLLREQWQANEEDMPQGGLLLRDIDNHDTVTDWPERTEKAAGHDGMEQIIAMNFIIDGVPMVYCGNEIACEAKLNMFANRFYPGEFSPTDRSLRTPESLRRREVIQKLNGFRKSSITLREGQTHWLEHDKPEHIVAFSRISEEEEWFFIGNAGSELCTVVFEKPVCGKVMLTNDDAQIFQLGENILTLHAKKYYIICRAQWNAI